MWCYIEVSSCLSCIVPKNLALKVFLKPEGATTYSEITPYNPNALARYDYTIERNHLYIWGGGADDGRSVDVKIVF